ncbi:MAG TPA: amino acid adenylation domain-containing protein, partial [Bryobacteraceae bacterium]|nr:amino acid adenylation domain-containing protein [Bryobacteraceae bacterium]
APYPRNQCVHHLVEEQVKRSPGAIAITFGNYRLTYRALNRRANRLAHHLREVGVGPEMLIGVCVKRSTEMVVAMLAVLKAGAAYVALDPAWPRARQALVIEDAAMSLVLTQEDVAHRLSSGNAACLCLDTEWSAVSQEPDTNPDVPTDQQQLAYILYTSGSTGRPKGVAIEHRSVVAFLSWAKSVFPPDELSGTLAATSICFDLSVFEIFLPLSCGGAIVLAENALALPGLPARDQVTLINTVPSSMTALLSVGGVPKSVRVVNLAGEPLSNKLVQDSYRLGTVEKVYNLYGPSEDTTYSTYVLISKGATQNPTIGRPISNTQVHILDERLEPVPVGTAGELCLAGDGLARGYLNRPELTAEKFIPNPFGAGRLYRTGDLARRLTDGNIEFLGRMDYQVKVRGFRIELGEVEAALERHPAVERAVVLALPDALDELYLAAFLVPRTGALEMPAQEQDSAEHISLWQDVYETLYRHRPASGDLSFNIIGWRSSYNDQPIPAPEMREWLEETVGRILALNPRDVLEIGCGTGMLLAQVAPRCSSYVGLDFAAAGLNHIRRMQETVPGLERVTLLERRADALGDFAPHSFDTIVLNSVVQHFPDAGYLVRVLTEAIRLLKPGGSIFIGDVMNLCLLEAFHASVQVYRASDSHTCGQVRERIRRHAAQGRDLLLAPPFFLCLAQQHSSITRVQVLPKRGRFHNELTCFRYDAILHAGDTAAAEPEPVWLDWQREKLTIAEVRRLLTETQPEILAIRNIPNARLEREMAAIAWLREAAPGDTMGRLRAYLAQQPQAGIDPDDIADLAAPGDAQPYRGELSWLNSDHRATFDAIFSRCTQPKQFFSRVAMGGADGWLPWREFANDPRRARLGRELVPGVRQFLREKLPRYMTPAVFTVLDKLPLSPNGKVDRRTLAHALTDADPVAGDGLPVSLRPIEQLLVSVWADILNLSFVGRDDDFFSIGGTSLTAMALLHRLEVRLNRSLPHGAAMELSTVAEFAAYLEETFPDVVTGLADNFTDSGGRVIAIEEGEI